MKKKTPTKKSKLNSQFSVGVKNFTRIASAILPKNYELSVVFADDKLTRSLNRKYRGKNKPANVLSFPLSKNSGEIFLNSKRIKKDAPKFGLSQKNCTIYMFIHALLHLKGFEHSARMDAQERRFLKMFKIDLPESLKTHSQTNGKKNISRN